MDADWSQKVTRSTIDPVFTNEVDACKWDAEKLVLTTPQDEENAKAAALEQAAWYKDAFGENAFDLSKKEKKKQLGAKELEDLHAECSVKTVSKKPGRYEGSPGAEMFVVGQRRADKSAEVRNADDLEHLSKEELLRMLRGAHISPQKGSQPARSKAGASGSDAGESSSSGEHSGMDSGSSSSHTSLSSAESKSLAGSLATGE